jgi:hypothetical protein
MTAVYLFAAFMTIVTVGCTLALIHDWVERRLE